MTNKQYKNIIQMTLLNKENTAEKEDVEVLKKVFDNCGVPFPTGTKEEVTTALKNGTYVGWSPCSAAEAQAAANEGIASVGISNTKAYVVEPDATDTLSASAEINSEYSVNTKTLTAEEEESTEFFAQAKFEYDADGNISVMATGGSTMSPHGTYRTYTCSHAAVCNDGIGESYDDLCHQDTTAYMGGTLNADIHRYIVLPINANDYASLLGCVGVSIRSNGTYVFGVVGEGGPRKDAQGIIDEFSVKMIKDLGFDTDGARYVSPEDTVTTYIFPDTKRSSWSSSTLNSEVAAVGRNYFY